MTRGITKALCVAIAGIPSFAATPQSRQSASVNLAPFAVPRTSYVSGHESLEAINSGYEPRSVDDHSHGAYGNWPRTGTQWVELGWDKPISTAKVDVYWWDDSRGVRLPVSSRLLYWDGTRFVSVPDPQGLGVVGGRYNTTTFGEVKTTRLRLEFDGSGTFSTGILQWKVYDSGGSPKFPPRVEAGVDRVAVLPAMTFLHGRVVGADRFKWNKLEGPGKVTFGSDGALDTTASFTSPGRYTLALTAWHSGLSTSDRLQVVVEKLPTLRPLKEVPTYRHSITSAFWWPRIRAQIVNWIPHCIEYLSRPDLPEGGFVNFEEAAKKNQGLPHKAHVGPPWANAYTLNTLEAMCLAQQVDPRGDPAVIASQAAIREKIEAWVPVILRAQETDGYLQTRFTLGMPNEQGVRPPRWTYVGDHEGYVGGYFIDAAIAHFWMTGGRDRRMIDAAIRLADCWAKNIGPAPKRKWYDGHQAMEQALVRLARLIDETVGARRGDRYVELSKFLMSCRGGGDSYDQAHVPVIEQYEALGHSVRAAYLYSAMADVAMETGDAAYHSSVKSLWESIVNTKYYVTGGIGSGETSEGFGKPYSLPNSAYCESCANCGQLFFQHKMNMAYHEGRYGDLMEETLYNAILGSVDLDGNNFTYTNPLDQGFARYGWHVCPCCVGNIARTLLMLPTWGYAKDASGLYVNLYVGGKTNVGDVLGTQVEITQVTDYPWKGSVKLVVDPARAQTFALRLRVPSGGVSSLYRAVPVLRGLSQVKVNGKALSASPSAGYLTIRRKWKAGDSVTFSIPMAPQQVTADPRLAATQGRVALKYGPLIYNIESVDQNVDSILDPSSPLSAVWKPGLLGGVMVIDGRFGDGKPLMAIPNYARNNRGGRSVVWIRAKQ